MDELLSRVLRWIGVDPAPPLLRLLSRYREWLATEAIPAGGLGPDESDRLDTRHVADALVFAGVWDRSSHRPVVDVGTGVGLPGIPLAIAFPDRDFRLVDRSRRRLSLAQRAIRVLDLSNVSTVETDIADVDWRDATVVSRASLRPEALRGLVVKKGAPGELLVAGSHQQEPIVAGFETVSIPSEILDRRVWLLRMVRS
jgi:16S rRNA (guanine527-N7)-methyltransferase